MAPPTTNASLEQLISALRWVKNCIPKFTELIRPLQELIECIYDRVGKRTKQAFSRLSIFAVVWGISESEAFEYCKKILGEQTTLAHLDEIKWFRVYTEASDTIWSGILTQVIWEDLFNVHKEQRLEPLAFLSRRFNNTQFGWATIEKEGYAVIETLEHMHWLRATPDGFDLYTDHNNLIFLFNPLSVVPDLSQTSLREIHRWAVHLSVYNYTSFYIKGSNNVWARL